MKEAKGTNEKVFSKNELFYIRLSWLMNEIIYEEQWSAFAPDLGVHLYSSG